MIDNEEYVYEMISDEKNARICAQLLADQFSANGPFSRFHSMSSEYFFDEIAWPLVQNVLDERLSFLARHRSTGEIIGTVTANDAYTEHEKHPYDASGPPATVPIIDILDEMSDMFVSRDFGQELKPCMVLHIGMGATRADHTNKGVATRLRKIACDHARDTRGFQYALVQAINPAMRHIYLKKMGGKIVTEVDSNTWIWKKKGSGTLCPYKEFKGPPIPNILVKLTQDESN